MALLVIALKECADLTVLWTAVNVNALLEAAHRFDQLFTDASDEFKQSYVRFLSQNEGLSCSKEEACSERCLSIGFGLRQFVVLMTEDGFLVEQGFAVNNMNIQADISLKDDSQQDGIAIVVGHPAQTKLCSLTVLAMKKLVPEIEPCDPSMRCRSLHWVPTNEWCVETVVFCVWNFSRVIAQEMNNLALFLILRSMNL
jgi:hypothetical protein